jgi:hypothetical protein
MRNRRSKAAATGMVAILMLAGCSQPGPLAKRMSEPQTPEDVVEQWSGNDVVVQSMRLVGEYDGRRFWAAKHLRSSDLCMMSMGPDETAFDSVVCGRIGVPYTLGGEDEGEAWLLLDGMERPDPADGWTAVTPYLYVR